MFDRLKNHWNFYQIMYCSINYIRIIYPWNSCICATVTVGGFLCDNAFLCVCFRYPADVKAFTRSGIKGVWEREKAGKRMKLQEPETWERLLSREGNKAATWEKLIGTNKAFLKPKQKNLFFFAFMFLLLFKIYYAHHGIRLFNKSQSTTLKKLVLSSAFWKYGVKKKALHYALFNRCIKYS